MTNTQAFETRSKALLDTKEKLGKQHSKGKLTARERLDAFFDKGTFIEVGSFVRSRCENFGMQAKRIDGDGVVTGYGEVNGRQVFAYAQDFTVLGGSLGEMHANKICHIQDMAFKALKPLVGLNDSGGARIQEGIDALAGYGRIFYRNTQASGVIPQITAIMGPCAGGAVYSPALTDFIFMTKDTARMFITGPEVIRSVTGEDITEEQLGGSSAHSQKSGVVHFVCDDDLDCLERIKTLLSYLPDNYLRKAPLASTIGPGIGRIESIVPENQSKPYDMHLVIKSIADKGVFLESQESFAKNIITALCRINGESVGIIASQPLYMAGCIDIDASDKAARFVRFCDAFGIALVSLVDVPGYLPGSAQEYGGIIRHGAKLLYAYSEATVAKVTVVLRKAYGGAYIAMCSQELGADACFAWPDAEIAVMGSDGAAKIIFRNEDPQTQAVRRQEYQDEFASPFKAAEHLLIDDVIEPKSTRSCIIKALSMFRSKQRIRQDRFHGNLPL